MVRIKVPATSANLGPGFDCVGMALDMHNFITVEEHDGKGFDIQVSGEGDQTIPRDEENLVYISMKAVFDSLGYSHKGIRMKLHNNIPLARGLGSSAACIAGGMTAANIIAGQPLGIKQIINMAARMDGHPDNILPALVGGMTVGCMEGNDVYYVRLDPPTKIKFAVMVPDFELATSRAREVMPSSVPLGDAVFNIGRAALMVASFLTGKIENLMVATEDRIHQPYRKELIPGFDDVLRLSKEFGAKGVFLSGAGPAIIAVLNGEYHQFEVDMREGLSSFKPHWNIQMMELCRSGVEQL